MPHNQLRINEQAMTNADGVQAPDDRIHDLLNEMFEALQGSCIKLRELDARRTELQAANSAEVERRRTAERRVAELEAALRAVLIMTNRALLIADLEVARCRAERNYRSMVELHPPGEEPEKMLPPRSRAMMKCRAPGCPKGATGADGHHCSEHQGNRSAIPA